MTLCREWTLVKASPAASFAKPLLCRSWGCDHCRPLRKNQLLAHAAAGQPSKFLTLTINPRVGSDPADRLRILSHAWNVLVKRLRRLYDGDEVEYLAVAEETKAGEPHLHILLRSPFIPQALISAAMDELASSPIVDIRKVRNAREVVSYVAKYITKAPAQFGNAKRYWSSQSWEIEDEPFENTSPLPETRWMVFRETLRSVINLWIHDGLLSRQYRGEIVCAWPPERGPPA